MSSGYVYMIGTKEADYYYVKIGKAINPIKRLGSLQIGNHKELELYGVRLATSDAVNLERSEHERFRANCVRGEWFKFSEDEFDDVRKDYDVIKHSVRCNMGSEVRSTLTCYMALLLAGFNPHGSTDRLRTKKISSNGREPIWNGFSIAVLNEYINKDLSDNALLFIREHAGLSTGEEALAYLYFRKINAMTILAVRSGMQAISDWYVFRDALQKQGARSTVPVTRYLTTTTLPRWLVSFEESPERFTAHICAARTKLDIRATYEKLGAIDKIASIHHIDAITT